MNYFKECRTVASIKGEYRRLAKLYHPDIGGDTEMMKNVNLQYHAALAACDEQTCDDRTYHYNRETEQQIMDKLYDILRIKMTANVLLIGIWIWIDGDTRPVRDQLKKLGCLWNPRREMWYWKPSWYKTRHSRCSIAEIAARYGYREFGTTEKETTIAGI